MGSWTDPRRLAKPRVEGCVGAKAERPVRPWRSPAWAGARGWVVSQRLGTRAANLCESAYIRREHANIKPAGRNVTRGAPLRDVNSSGRIVESNGFMAGFGISRPGYGRGRVPDGKSPKVNARGPGAPSFVNGRPEATRKSAENSRSVACVPLTPILGPRARGFRPASGTTYRAARAPERHAGRGEVARNGRVYTETSRRKVEQGRGIYKSRRIPKREIRRPAPHARTGETPSNPRTERSRARSRWGPESRQARRGGVARGGVVSLRSPHHWQSPSSGSA